MVFLVTKAALAATLVGIGVTFGALSYLARRGQANNGEGTLDLNFPTKEPPPLFQLFPHSGSPGGFSLLGTPRPDCNCKLVTECDGVFRGVHSFRLSRTCGFQGFQRKICCDEPYFSTPPPQYALDGIKNIHTQLDPGGYFQGGGGCLHNHEQGIEGCSCDHEFTPDVSEGSLRSDVTETSEGGSEGETVAPEVEGDATVKYEVSSVKPKIKIPDLSEYFPEGSGGGSGNDEVASAPFETLITPNDKGRMEDVKNALSGEGTTIRIDTSSTEGSGSSTRKFPSLNEYFPEDGASDNHHQTATTTVSSGSSTEGNMAPEVTTQRMDVEDLVANGVDKPEEITTMKPAEVTTDKHSDITTAKPETVKPASTDKPEELTTLIPTTEVKSDDKPGEMTTTIEPSAEVTKGVTSDKVEETTTVKLVTEVTASDKPELTTTAQPLPEVSADKPEEITPVMSTTEVKADDKPEETTIQPIAEVTNVSPDKVETTTFKFVTEATAGDKPETTTTAQPAPEVSADKPEEITTTFKPAPEVIESDKPTEQTTSASVETTQFPTSVQTSTSISISKGGTTTIVSDTTTVTPFVSSGRSIDDLEDDNDSSDKPDFSDVIMDVGDPEDEVTTPKQKLTTAGSFDVTENIVQGGSNRSPLSLQFDGDVTTPESKISTAGITTQASDVTTVSSIPEVETTGSPSKSTEAAVTSSTMSPGDTTQTVEKIDKPEITTVSSDAPDLAPMETTTNLPTSDNPKVDMDVTSGTTTSSGLSTRDNFQDPVTENSIHTTLTPKEMQTTQASVFMDVPSTPASSLQDASQAPDELITSSSHPSTTASDTTETDVSTMSPQEISSKQTESDLISTTMLSSVDLSATTQSTDVVTETPTTPPGAAQSLLNEESSATTTETVTSIVSKNDVKVEETTPTLDLSSSSEATTPQNDIRVVERLSTTPSSDVTTATSDPEDDEDQQTIFYDKPGTPNGTLCGQEDDDCLANTTEAAPTPQGKEVESPTVIDTSTSRSTGDEGETGDATTPSVLDQILSLLSATVAPFEDATEPSMETTESSQTEKIPEVTGLTARKKDEDKPETTTAGSSAQVTTLEPMIKDDVTQGHSAVESTTSSVESVTKGDPEITTGQPETEASDKAIMMQTTVLVTDEITSTTQTSTDKIGGENNEIKSEVTTEKSGTEDKPETTTDTSIESSSKIEVETTTEARSKVTTTSEPMLNDDVTQSQGAVDSTTSSVESTSRDSLSELEVTTEHPEKPSDKTIIMQTTVLITDEITSTTQTSDKVGGDNEIETSTTNQIKNEITTLGDKPETTTGTSNESPKIEAETTTAETRSKVTTTSEPMLNNDVTESVMEQSTMSSMDSLSEAEMTTRHPETNAVMMQTTVLITDEITSTTQSNVDKIGETTETSIVKSTRESDEIATSTQQIKNEVTTPISLQDNPVTDGFEMSTANIKTADVSSSDFETTTASSNGGLSSTPMVDMSTESFMLQTPTSSPAAETTTGSDQSDLELNDDTVQTTDKPASSLMSTTIASDGSEITAGTLKIIEIPVTQPSTESDLVSTTKEPSEMTSSMSSADIPENGDTTTQSTISELGLSTSDKPENVDVTSEINGVTSTELASESSTGAPTTETAATTTEQTGSKSAANSQTTIVSTSDDMISTTSGPIPETTVPSPEASISIESSSDSISQEMTEGVTTSTSETSEKIATSTATETPTDPTVDKQTTSIPPAETPENDDSGNELIPTLSSMSPTEDTPLEKTTPISLAQSTPSQLTPETDILDNNVETTIFDNFVSMVSSTISSFMDKTTEASVESTVSPSLDDKETTPTSQNDVTTNGKSSTETVMITEGNTLSTTVGSQTGDMDETTVSVSTSKDAPNVDILESTTLQMLDSMEPSQTPENIEVTTLPTSSPITSTILESTIKPDGQNEIDNTLMSTTTAGTSTMTGSSDVTTVFPADSESTSNIQKSRPESTTESQAPEQDITTLSPPSTSSNSLESTIKSIESPDQNELESDATTLAPNNAPTSTSTLPPSEPEATSLSPPDTTMSSTTVNMESETSSKSPEVTTTSSPPMFDEMEATTSSQESESSTTMRQQVSPVTSKDASETTLSTVDDAPSSTSASLDSESTTVTPSSLMTSLPAQTTLGSIETLSTSPPEEDITTTARPPMFDEMGMTTPQNDDIPTSSTIATTSEGATENVMSTDKAVTFDDLDITSSPITIPPTSAPTHAPDESTIRAGDANEITTMNPVPQQINNEVTTPISVLNPETDVPNLERTTTEATSDVTPSSPQETTVSPKITTSRDTETTSADESSSPIPSMSTESVTSATTLLPPDLMEEMITSTGKGDSETGPLFPTRRTTERYESTSSAPQDITETMNVELSQTTIKSMEETTTGGIKATSSPPTEKDVETSPEFMEGTTKVASALLLETTQAPPVATEVESSTSQTLSITSSKIDSESSTEKDISTPVLTTQGQMETTTVELKTPSSPVNGDEITTEGSPTFTTPTDSDRSTTDTTYELTDGIPSEDNLDTPSEMKDGRPTTTDQSNQDSSTDSSDMTTTALPPQNELAGKSEATPPAVTSATSDQIGMSTTAQNTLNENVEVVTTLSYDPTTLSTLEVTSQEPISTTDVSKKEGNINDATTPGSLMEEVTTDNSKVESSTDKITTVSPMEGVETTKMVSPEVVNDESGTTKGPLEDMNVVEGNTLESKAPTERTNADGGMTTDGTVSEASTPQDQVTTPGSIITTTASVEDATEGGGDTTEGGVTSASDTPQSQVSQRKNDKFNDKMTEATLDSVMEKTTNKLITEIESTTFGDNLMADVTTEKTDETTTVVLEDMMIGPMISKDGIGSNESHESYSATTEFGDLDTILDFQMEQAGTLPEPRTESSSKSLETTSQPDMDETSDPSEIEYPVTEITKSIRREPDTDKTVVELISMYSKVKTKIRTNVQAIRTGSERSVSQFTTEGRTTTTSPDLSTFTPPPEASGTPDIITDATTETQTVPDMDTDVTTRQPITTKDVATSFPKDAVITENVSFDTTLSPLSPEISRTETQVIVSDDGEMLNETQIVFDSTTTQASITPLETTSQPEVKVEITTENGVTTTNLPETESVTNATGKTVESLHSEETVYTGSSKIGGITTAKPDEKIMDEVVTEKMDEVEFLPKLVATTSSYVEENDTEVINDTMSRQPFSLLLETTVYQMEMNDSDSSTTQGFNIDPVVMTVVNTTTQTYETTDPVTTSTMIPVSSTTVASTVHPEMVDMTTMVAPVTTSGRPAESTETPQSTPISIPTTSTSPEGVIFDDQTAPVTDSTTIVDFESTSAPSTEIPKSTTVAPLSFLEEFYDTLFGPNARSASANITTAIKQSLEETTSATFTTTMRTTTTPEPLFKVEVKVGPHDARSLFSSQSTSAERVLEGEISNVVSQLLLTTHKNFHLLPSFVECAGARGRGRRKTKVLHFDTDNYPWMARVGFKEPGGVTFPCAGTIIARRYVLTSAHCATRKFNGTDPYLMEILLEGAKNAAAGTTNQLRFKYKVEEIIPHPNYNPISREHDLAVIRLTSDIPFNASSEIKPICLPFEDGYGVWDSLPTLGDTAFLGGWGYGLKNMAAEVEEMDRAAVTIWDNDNCTYLYRGDEDKKITSQHICAYGNAEKDACRGDNGGPLMALMTRQKIFFQIGIVSYGPRCGYGVPGVYTRVSDYLSWILDTLTE